tara:strand:- start:273 stop:956 length:684 start_codon:yes stop_codon:yes gene_type:complete
MTDQFDEGVKEILMTILSLGATAFETQYILDVLKDRPEPIEQKITAVQKADELISSPKFDQVADELLVKLQDMPPKPEPETKEYDYGSPQYIVNRLIEGGLTKTAAIGIVANLKAESNLDPSIKQKGGGPGRGLAQWEKGGRYDTDRINLVSFARDQGKDWKDLNTQIDFILHELNIHPEYKKVKKEINEAENIKDAVLIFLKKYEKAGTPHTEKRLEYGRELEKSI